MNIRFAFVPPARLLRDVSEKPECFLLAFCAARSELRCFVAFKTWLAALHEEIPQVFQARHATGERVVRNLFQTRQPSKLPKIAAYTYTSVKLFFPARIQKKCNTARMAMT